MPNEKKFQATFSIRDEASQKIEAFRQKMRALNVETKYHLKPLTDLRQAWMRVGLTWGFATGGAVAAISKLAQMREEIKKLDELSIKLGVSTEDLSKKMHGFNIATDKARIGAGQLKKFMEDNWDYPIAWWKTKANEAAGSLDINALAQRLALRDTGTMAGWERYKGIAYHQLATEQRKNLESSPDALSSRADVLNKTRQLSFTEQNYKAFMFKQEVESLKAGGVDPTTLAGYTNAYKNRMAQEQNKEYTKLLADRYRAEGDTLRAIKLEHENALNDFKQKWGSNSVMLEEFRAGQRAMLENAKLTALGLKNNAQIWQDGQRQVIAGMSSSWENFFSDFFNRDLKKGSEYFRMFGQQILQTWSKMLAEMVTKYMVAQAQMAASQAAGGGSGGARARIMQNINTTMSWIRTLTNVAGLFSGGGSAAGGVGGTYTGYQPVGPDGSLAPTWSPYHRGGLVRAHSGLAVDEVPIIAKRGEYVLSERGVAAAGGIRNVDRINRGESTGGQVTVIFNVTAMDASSFKEQLLKHPDVYESVINNAILRKHDLKRTVKKYASN